jgi:hypothetical protein
MEQFINATVNDKRSVPFNAAGTGTIVTKDKVITGTGTLFVAELPVGSYIVSEAQDKCIKVIRVDSDTEAVLEYAFTSDLTSAAPSIIKAHQMKAKSITLVTAAANFVNGGAYTGTMEITRGGNEGSQRSDLLEPIILDSTTGATVVRILNF